MRTADPRGRRRARAPRRALPGRCHLRLEPAPAELVPEGPQPQSGDDWRLLACAPPVGTVWDTSVAVDRTGYEEPWRTLDLPGTPPAVDLEREIVPHFGPAVSGSCPNIRLDGLRIEDELVYAEIVRSGVQPSTCTADTSLHTYLVAVERLVLPATPFCVQLDPDACPRCETKSDLTLVEIVYARPPAAWARRSGTPRSPHPKEPPRVTPWRQPADRRRLGARRFARRQTRSATFRRLPRVSSRAC